MPRTRGISFEEIVVAIEAGDVLDVLTHHSQTKYPNQQVYLVEYQNYVFVVPFVRDITKRYLRKEEEHEQYE